MVDQFLSVVDQFLLVMSHVALNYCCPPGLWASDAETATQSRERRHVALACKEMGSYLSTTMNSRFEEVSPRVDAAKTDIELVLCGMSLSLGKGWESTARKSHKVSSHPETYDIHSMCSYADSVDEKENLQLDQELSPERDRFAQLH